MDQLESTDITFGAGDIDGLGFPSSDDHIAASGGHGLQTESLATPTRHGQNELMFPSAQLDMSEYDSSLAQNVGMGQLDAVMNTDVRPLSMDNIQNRSESEMGHMRPRHAFSGDGSGPRAYTMNQLHGFQQIQQTQPIGQNHTMANSVQQMYPRNEQPFQAPTNFDVNAFLNTRQPQQQVIPSTCAMPQIPFMGNYVESNHPINQPQNQAMHQFSGQHIRPNPTAASPSIQPRLPPTSGISAMLSGIKSETLDTSCSRRQKHTLPPISQALNGSVLNQHRIPPDIFGMVADALPTLKFPPAGHHDGIHSGAEDLVAQGLPVEHRIVNTVSPVPVNNSLLPTQQNDRLHPDVAYQQNGPRRESLEQIAPSNCNAGNDVRDDDEASSATDDDEGMEDDKDEDYVPHMEDVTYKHKKLMKARQRKGQRFQSQGQECTIKADERQHHAQEQFANQIQNHAQEQFANPIHDHAQGYKEHTPTTPKKNPIEGITLDVGPDGTTSLKVNFVPGQTMAQELVAAFQNVLEKQLKHGQEDIETVNNQSTANNANSDVPSVLELSFKLTTPEKTKTPAGTVKEYDKPKRSWKERAHHEQEERADVELVPSKTPHDSSDPATLTSLNDGNQSSEPALKEKVVNEDSQDTVTGGSDEGRQEIALDEDEYEADENASDLGGQVVTPGGEERLRNGGDAKEPATNPDLVNASTAANAIASSIITQQMTPIVPAGNTSSIDKNELNITIEDSQCITQEDGSKRWQCLQCPKSYTTKHNLMTHMLGHNGIKPHCCLICGRFFKQISHLNTHMLTHGHIKPHVCTICNRAFTQASHAKRHMAIHMERRPYACDICDRGFAYPSELKAHKEKHNKAKDSTCEICGEGFESAKKLQHHEQAVHKNMQDVTCKTCGKVFVYPSQLKDHEIKHSGKRPFICGECGMDFMKEHHLKAHQFTHTGLKPWFCPICDRSFNQKANMQRHMLIHETDKKYKCETCDKTFSQPQTLKAHQVTHADKKPFQCKVCGKEFSRFHNLQGHMHMHQDSKPHLCVTCGASFTLKGNLNRHKKVKHGINEPVDTSEEEAAKILNAMSGNKRLADHFTEESYEGHSGEGFPGEGGDGMDDPGSSPSITPNKKKRKSTPRKTIPTVKTLDGEGEDGFNGVGAVAWPGDEIVPGGPRTVIAGGMAVTITGNKAAEETDGDDDVEGDIPELSNNNVVSENVEGVKDDSQIDSINGASDQSKDGIATDEESSESVDVQRKNLATLIAKKFKPPLKT